MSETDLRTAVKLLGWELLTQTDGEWGGLGYQVKLRLAEAGGGESECALKVLAVSPHFIITPIGVLDRRRGCEIGCEMMTFDEFLHLVDKL